MVCDGLVRVYLSGTGQTHALRGIDLTVAAGTVTAIAGPSGSGKSSLLRLLAARDRPSAGRLLVLGRDISSMQGGAVRRLRRRSVSFVEQRSSVGLFPHLHFADQVRQVAALRGVRGVDPPAVLESVGLGHRAANRPAQASGGEQQRLAVALALIGPPEIVVADEPTAELDHANTDVVLRALRSAADAGSTVVVSSHDHRALGFADRVLRLQYGVLSSEQVQQGEHVGMIDSTGRLQLPPDALAVLRDGRAVIEVVGDRVVLRPPSADS